LIPLDGKSKKDLFIFGYTRLVLLSFATVWLPRPHLSNNVSNSLKPGSLAYYDLQKKDRSYVN